MTTRKKHAFVEKIEAFCLDLLSRKFLLTLGFGVVLVTREQYTELVGLLVAYLGVQGAQEFFGE